MALPLIFLKNLPEAKRLPFSIELLPLELPGRGCRLSEKMTCHSLGHLAKEAVDGIGELNWICLDLLGEFFQVSLFGKTIKTSNIPLKSYEWVYWCLLKVANYWRTLKSALAIVVSWSKYGQMEKLLSSHSCSHAVVLFRCPCWISNFTQVVDSMLCTVRHHFSTSNHVHLRDLFLISQAEAPSKAKLLSFSVTPLEHGWPMRWSRMHV